MSSLRGSALYLHLRKALNGLRIASMEWINFLSEIVRKTGSKGSGLKGCSIEPCLFTGFLESGPCALLVYVDDILVMAKSEKDVDLIFATIEKHVTLKRTGLIYPSHSGGGVIRFLGRVISRRKGERSLLVSLPPDYLDGTFKDYGLVGNASKIARDPSDPRGLLSIQISFGSGCMAYTDTAGRACIYIHISMPTIVPDEPHRSRVA